MSCILTQVEHKIPLEELVGQLNTDIENGMTNEKASKRIQD